MKKIKYLLLSSAVVAAMSSCGTKGTVIRADELSGEDFIDPNIEASATPLQTPIPAKPTTPPKKTDATPRVKPPRSNRGLHTPGTPAVDAASASALAGEWTIVKADDTQIVQDDDMPYIIFSEKDHRFYCFNGCNTINGSYVVNADKSVIFSNVLQTLMECPHINYQSAISKVVNGSKPVKTKIEKNGNETYVTFIYEGKDALVLRRHNMEGFSGEWGVVGIGDEAIDGDEVNVFFDIPELTVHGNTGCNFFNGIIEVDPNSPSSISFAQMAVTKRACHNSEIERNMLVALEEVSNYKIVDDKTLLLQDNSGKTLIILKRMSE